MHDFSGRTAVTPQRARKAGRGRVAAFSLIGALALLGPGGQLVPMPAQAADAAVTKAVNPKIDLKVLVVSDGSPMIAAYQDRLTREGIPYQVLDLAAANRPVLNDAFLTVTDPEAPHARFQGVIMPNSSPAGLGAAELTTLHQYQAKFGVRQISAYVWPSAQHGMNTPTYSGAVDGTAATVTAAAKADGHGYLKGPVALDDIDGTVTESYGYLATPANTPGVTVTPFVTAPIPGGSGTGVLSGVFDDGSRQEWFNTYASNQYQQHFQVLSHGQLEWLTRGVRLGQYANWFSVHSDDVMMADALWNSEGNCTYGDDCDENQYPSDAPGTTARMTAADVTYQRDWQRNWDFKIDVVYNGAGSVEYSQQNKNAPDPVLTAFRNNSGVFRFIDHTYTHANLGCERITTGLGSWQCARDSKGVIKYIPRATITSEINQNKTFASKYRLPVEANALVTGQHSGLMSLPQMPQDNPNLGPALTATGTKWVASDASRETEQRKVGSALTVPRHPMNIYYNTATRAQAVDEYNWIYTSRAKGGSGLCEDNPATSTCIEPLSTGTGFQDYIVPIETRIAMSHVVGNDPRPHYVHQTNQTQDRIIYPVLEQVIGSYRATFAQNTPIVNPTMAQAGQELQAQGVWAQEKDATAFYWKGQVRVAATGNGASVPVSMPAGSKVGAAALKGSYAGKATDRLTVGAGRSTTLTVGQIGWGTTAPATVAAPNKFTNKSVPQGPSTTELAPEEPVAVEAPVGTEAASVR